ncbi:MAG TPA: Ig-like domain-containing protein, partial [Gemmatimonadaceae bacterium]|nr:Ig-like domain-containing protein [Gemmatimonadaceae bacterium]
AGLLALLIGGCKDTGIEPLAEEPGTIIVPGLVISESRSDAARVAYVSAEPGTFHWAAQIRIRNLNTADAGISVTVHEGGFDPAAIPASTGDRFELSITDLSGAVSYARAVVPARRPPVIVRTNLPKVSTDVAISIRPVVIFSEPIDPQSLDETSIRLLRDGVSVSGALAPVTGSPFAVELTPEGLLEPLTGYELVVTPVVLDLDGESLAEEYRLPFTTGFHPGAGVLRISNLTTGGAFDVDGYQVRVTVAGQEPRTVGLELNTSFVIGDMPPGEASVELDDVAPNCSVSGGSSRTVAIQQLTQIHVEFQAACTPPPELGAVRLVFSRAVVHSTAEWGHHSHLWAMNADGTDLRQLTHGATYDAGPIVSPDGARIAFSRPEWMWEGDAPFTYVMDADGSNPRRLSYGYASSWSPDGSTIAVDARGISSVGTYLIGADGSGFRPLVNNAWQPVWSPDGHRIAFRRDAEGIVGGCNDPTAAHEIWTISVDLTDPVLVKQFSPCSWGGHLSWSSDGRILFEDREPDEPAPLWSIRPDGSDLVRLLEPSRMHFGVFSHDGKLVTMRPGPDGPRDIFLMNVEDGSVVRVTADGLSGGAAFLR